MCLYNIQAFSVLWPALAHCRMMECGDLVAQYCFIGFGVMCRCLQEGCEGTIVKYFGTKARSI